MQNIVLQIQQVVKDRPVAIVLPGTSVEELYARIDDFAHMDICWTTMNFYWITEAITDRIFRRMEMVICIDPDVLNRFQHKFGPQVYPGLFISREHFTEYGGNTLFCYLQLLIDAGIKTVVLFGADGYKDKKPFYFKEDKFEGGIPNGRGQELKQNTEQFNKDFPTDHKNTKIYNCSLESKYEPFEKISYDQAAYILSQEPQR